MASTATPSPDSISDSEFQDLLRRYPACLAAISESKGAKPGQKTLASLDKYRYETAPARFGPGNPDVSMGLDDVKALVEWKLRHGKFRPTLMKLVSSNDARSVQEIIHKAVKHYREKSDSAGALDILTQLKGIGPATASLLLAVHDPERIIFFSDEAFYWLCCQGSKSPIKYSQKEYAELSERAQALAKRLGVHAVDVERVAYVLMREPAEHMSTTAAKPPTGSPAVATGKVKTQPGGKRKASGDDSAVETPSHRRRKRPLPISPCVLDRMSRTKRGEMQSFAGPGPIQLTPRFTALKESLTSGNETALNSSWQRLLRDLPLEIDSVSSLGSRAIPAINFLDSANPQQAERFLQDLRKRGVGIIRSVVPRETALAWGQETEQYITQNAQMRPASPRHSRPLDVYWSASQVKARAHPNLLAAQKFVMSIWKSKHPNARVTTNFPVTYADRMTTRRGTEGGGTPYAHVDGGSVERWEPDGYGRAGTYKEIFEGRWEDYDPWESSTRLAVTSDLYRKAGACSIFRMFQGWLALSTIPPGPGSVRVCPLPRHATAYFLLRPFFSPSSSPTSTTTPTASPCLDRTTTAHNEEWVLTRPQNSILHGAVPSYAQELNPALHPHLELQRSLVPVPQLEPGDYLVWHPDLVHSTSPTLDAGNATTTTTTTTPTTGDTSMDAAAGGFSYMYLPACPLTQTNALYLARQRKAFLLGQPGPDFGGGRGESEHEGRPGVQDVNDAGGDDGLRAMGLLPWDEEEADTDEEREVLAMANGILFPDLYDWL
ncbi:uncharacterized protein THITE_2081534 [Thermothielavioides terrestris NRRL 8126]|uniref:DUF1479-domain-containing protein n=1 Tax=Thermothielavioides terrestris (strain ATCC 38088 / NRRL 8126) TaxID=578455 RepID=G2REW0_THETT|nr:uncharacterized protein THITE_2081534 [Thermothielavioides terrestris NRRL 8126]AEO70243.1 hypothetical protein THITE_2081534 [Thermothielavioides terrestris NRRL 8126]